MDIERGFIKTSAGYLHYRAAGSGPPIVLLHINQQSSATYIELIEALAPAYRAIAIDYPSHGCSDHIFVQPSIHDYASWIVQVLDGLNIPRAHVLGEATGAAVSIQLGVAFPDRINNVILLNCPLYLDKQTADKRHSPLKNSLRPSDETGFPMTRTLKFMLEQDADHAPLHPTQSWMDRINTAQIEAGRERWQALDALHEFDIAAGLEKLQKKTLLLIGEYFYYLRYKDEFVSRVEGIEVQTIPQARFCMGWEHAGDIAGRVTAFIQKAE